MSFDIVVPQNDADFNLLTAGGGGDKLSFIPGLKLLQNMSKQVTDPEDDDPECRAGEFLLYKTNFGNSVECVPMGYRAKAVKFEDSELQFTLYDVNHPMFQKMLKSKKSGDRVGPEFLLYIPEVQQFALMHFTKTARRYASAVKECLDDRSPCVLYSEKVKTKKFSWYTPKAQKGAFEWEMPTDEEYVQHVMQIFTNPESDDVTADGSVSSRER